MASFKLNIARIRNCPPVGKVAKAIEAFGAPETEEFAVINHSAAEQSVFATVVRKTQQSLQLLDAKSRQITATTVEKVTAYPFALRVQAQLLEVYAGSSAAIEQVGTFLTGAISLPIEVEHIEMDIPAAIDTLSKSSQKFQLRSVRLSEYAHNSFVCGPYAPKFLDSQHGRDFMDEYQQAITGASVRLAMPGGLVTVNLCPRACFGFSCNEDDVPAVQALLRKLF